MCVLTSRTSISGSTLAKDRDGHKGYCTDRRLWAWGATIKVHDILWSRINLCKHRNESKWSIVKCSSRLKHSSHFRDMIAWVSVLSSLGELGWSLSLYKNELIGAGYGGMEPVVLKLRWEDCLNSEGRGCSDLTHTTHLTVMSRQVSKTNVQ